MYNKAAKRELVRRCLLPGVSLEGVYPNVPKVTASCG